MYEVVSDAIATQFHCDQECIVEPPLSDVALVHSGAGQRGMPRSLFVRRRRRTMVPRKLQSRAYPAQTRAEAARGARSWRVILILTVVPGFVGAGLLIWNVFADLTGLPPWP